jgi:hypothetical protein
MHWIPHCVRNDFFGLAMLTSPCLLAQTSLSYKERDVLAKPKQGEVCHPQFVRLNTVKHPCTGCLATLGMTKRYMQNDQRILLVQQDKVSASYFCDDLVRRGVTALPT